jgi:hypothetical protein
MSEIGKISVNGKAYDLDDLELGELESLEEFMGVEIGEMALGSIRATLYLVYLIKRRDEPGYTLDDARKEKFVAVKWGADEEGDPNDPLSGSGDGKESEPTDD